MYVGQDIGKLMDTETKYQTFIKERDVNLSRVNGNPDIQVKEMCVSKDPWYQSYLGNL